MDADFIRRLDEQANRLYRLVQRGRRNRRRRRYIVGILVTRILNDRAALLDAVNIDWRTRKRREQQLNIFSPRIHDVILNRFNNGHYLRMTRFEERQFALLCRIVLPSFETFRTRLCHNTLTPTQILYFLIRRLAHDVTFDQLAFEAGCGATTLWSKCHRMAMHVRVQLRNLLVRPQSHVNLMETVQFWREMYDIPAAYTHDGVHLDRKFPSGRHKTAYNNRHGRSSSNALISQASHNLITGACLGMPGSLHDANVLERSVFGEMLNDGRLTGGAEIQVGGETVHPVAVSDTAYALTQFNLVPRKGANLTAEERRFRTYLSKLRCGQGEATHGILKMRWRYLLGKCRDDLPSQVSLSDVCIILHNFLVLTSDDDSLMNYIISSEDGVPFAENGILQRNPDDVRDAYMRELGLL